MGRPNASPYFVGAYWPEGGPAFFFKPTALKAKHRHLHFDPAFRLPLYQAVFHDSVITTHHWTLDSLKFPQVARDNELLQLLYNVPPLLHLNGDTAAKRIAFLARQDAFFRPLHEELAHRALTEFQWLSRDRRVQRTVFEGGTQLIANFRALPARWKGRTLPPHSMLAVLPSGEERVYRAP